MPLNRRRKEGAGVLLERSGRQSEATSFADELEKQGSQESRAYAKIIKGEINHQRHDIVKAVQSFQASQTVMDL